MVVYDWLGGRQLPLGVSRMLTVVLGALVIVAALLAPRLGDNVINIINTIAGTLLGGLLAVFLLGMFVPRANSAGALIGLIAGAICLGGVIRATEIPRWWYGAFTVFPTLLVGATASYLFAPPPSKTISSTVWHKSWSAKPGETQQEVTGNGAHPPS